MHDFELHAHLIGKPGSRRQLNTPVLIVDLDVLERNIARMAQFARHAGVKLRPHTKTHKSIDIARRQVAAGAIGLCCVKIGEAEALAEASLTGLHITSPVVSVPSIARLMTLARNTDLTVVVDNADNVLQLAHAAEHVGASLGVMIDIDPGSHRTGVVSADTAVSLSRLIRSSPSLRYTGVQFYCGAEQHIHSFAERTATIGQRTDYLRTVIDRLTQDGAAPPIVTGGGTGTHRIDAALGVFTELQVGSYIFMDAEYLDCEAGEPGTTPYDTSLFVDTRVISTNTTGLVTVDGGLKAFASDAGVPAILAGAPSGSRYRFMGDEHGLVTLPPGSQAPQLGEIITLTAPHCDPTVNLYDTYHVVQGDVLKELWPVSARGRSR